MKRNVVVQAIVLVVLASVIAVVANAFASRTRRLVLPGYYPNALRVPPREPERVPPPPRTETAVTETAAPLAATPTTATTATIAQSPGPGQPPIPVPTTTIERPAGAPTPAPAVTQTAPAAPKVDLSKFQPHPDRAYVEISGEDAAALHAAGVLFLDARRTSIYEDGHIAGARTYSVWESDIDDKVNRLFEERPDPAEQNKPIVIYCSGGACEDSHMLSQKLWGIQFNNVYVYKDGFPDWQKRGGAVRTGANP
ncbi:MAG TPA: rhodanese-like domain-containing protein [Thermoanaerobaculia bacterium]